MLEQQFYLSKINIEMVTTDQDLVNEWFHQQHYLLIEILVFQMRQVSLCPGIDLEVQFLHLDFFRQENIIQRLRLFPLPLVFQCTRTHLCLCLLSQRLLVERLLECRILLLLHQEAENDEDDELEEGFSHKQQFRSLVEKGINLIQTTIFRVYIDLELMLLPCINLLDN